MKICTKCGNVFSNYSSLIDEDFCPLYDCHGKIVTVDDLMIPTVTTMIKKGWETTYCCSGHYDGPLYRIYLTTRPIKSNKFFDNLREFIDVVIDNIDPKIPISIEIISNTFDATEKSIVAEEFIKKISTLANTQEYIDMFNTIEADSNSDRFVGKYLSLRIGIDPEISTPSFDPLAIISDTKTVEQWLDINRILYNIANKLPIIDNRGAYLYENR